MPALLPMPSPRPAPSSPPYPSTPPSRPAPPAPPASPTRPSPLDDRRLIERLKHLIAHEARPIDTEPAPAPHPPRRAFRAIFTGIGAAVSAA